MEVQIKLFYSTYFTDVATLHIWHSQTFDFSLPSPSVWAIEKAEWVFFSLLIMVTYFHTQVFHVLGQFHNVSAEDISEDSSFDFGISPEVPVQIR